MAKKRVHEIAKAQGLTSKELLAKLKAAGYLGAPVVRMNLGSVDTGEDNRKEGVERCIAAFKKMLPLAMDLGIRITIENHGGVSGTVEGILDVASGRFKSVKVTRAEGAIAATYSGEDSSWPGLIELEDLGSGNTLRLKLVASER